MSKPVPFYLHDLGHEEIEAITEVFRGPILTTGETVARFEEDFRNLLHRKHAIAVSSCTGALHLSLIALGIGPGDEVITTPMTFVATALAIIEAGARPVFVDVEPDTGNLDADKVEAAITARTKAILPVHLFGLMCDMRRLRDIANRHGLHLVEDAAHCVEGTREGVRPGELGDTACFSFFATKNLACGEGGAIVTDNSRIYEKLKLLRVHGMDKISADRHREGYRHWDVTLAGWKYNLDNIHAAILLPQLKRLGAKLERRHLLAETYGKLLAPIEGVQLPTTRPNSLHARHLYPVWVNAKRRDSVIDFLQNRKIGVVVNYRAIHLLTFFREELGYRAGDFPNAETIGGQTISLPFYPTMPIEDLPVVAQALQAALQL